MEDVTPSKPRPNPTAVELWPRGKLHAERDEWPGMRSRWMVPPQQGGWTDYAVSEWELEEAAWTDLHHHDEINLVLEGELHVESDGHTVVAGPGDTVRVAAGQLGHYRAPIYARMFAVYGPNPGLPDESFSYEPLPPARSAQAPTSDR